MVHTIKKQSKRNPHTGAMEYRWSCSCDKTSVWFSTKVKRDDAVATHRAKHIVSG